MVDRVNIAEAYVEKHKSWRVYLTKKPDSLQTGDFVPLGQTLDMGFDSPVEKAYLCLTDEQVERGGKQTTLKKLSQQ